jgi:hypothetical protein
MAKIPRPYSRLTRATTSVGSYRSLWLAVDHLLVVASTGYSEEYRRIQFQNIQGFFTVASNRKNSWFLFWLFLGMFAGIIAAISYVADGKPIVSLIFLGIAGVGVVWNHLLGPSCNVYVVTGVQTLQLPSLVRRRKAMKVFARIEPLIADAQRELAVSPPAVTAPVAEPPPLP